MILFGPHLPFCICLSIHLAFCLDNDDSDSVIQKTWTPPSVPRIHSSSSGINSRGNVRLRGKISDSDDESTDLPPTTLPTIRRRVSSFKPNTQTKRPSPENISQRSVLALTSPRSNKLIYPESYKRKFTSSNKKLGGEFTIEKKYSSNVKSNATSSIDIENGKEGEVEVSKGKYSGDAKKKQPKATTFAVNYPQATEPPYFKFDGSGFDDVDNLAVSEESIINPNNSDENIYSSSSRVEDIGEILSTTDKSDLSLIRKANPVSKVQISTENPGNLWTDSYTSLFPSHPIVRDSSNVTYSNVTEFDKGVDKFAPRKASRINTDQPLPTSSMVWALASMRNAPSRRLHKTSTNENSIVVESANFPDKNAVSASESPKYEEKNLKLADRNVEYSHKTTLSAESVDKNVEFPESTKNVELTSEKPKLAEKNKKLAGKIVESGDKNVKSAESGNMNLKFIEYTDKNVNSASGNMQSTDKKLKLSDDNIDSDDKNEKSAESGNINMKFVESTRKNVESTSDNLKFSEKNLKLSDENVKAMEPDYNIVKPAKSSDENVRFAESTDKNAESATRETVYSSLYRILSNNNTSSVNLSTTDTPLATTRNGFSGYSDQPETKNTEFCNRGTASNCTLEATTRKNVDINGKIVMGKYRESENNLIGLERGSDDANNQKTPSEESFKIYKTNDVEVANFTSVNEPIRTTISNVSSNDRIFNHTLTSLGVDITNENIDITNATKPFTTIEPPINTSNSALLNSTNNTNQFENTTPLFDVEIIQFNNASVASNLLKYSISNSSLANESITEYADFTERNIFPNLVESSTNDSIKDNSVSIGNTNYPAQRTTTQRVIADASIALNEVPSNNVFFADSSKHLEKNSTISSTTELEIQNEISPSLDKLAELTTSSILSHTTVNNVSNVSTTEVTYLESNIVPTISVSYEQPSEPSEPNEMSTNPPITSSVATIIEGASSKASVDSEPSSTSSEGIVYSDLPSETFEMSSTSRSNSDEIFTFVPISTHSSTKIPFASTESEDEPVTEEVEWAIETESFSRRSPDHLLLYFKSSLAEICGKSDFLKESLYQFIARRSERLESRDQIVLKLDPIRCKYPDRKMRIVPVALYICDKFGQLDHSFISELKALLLADELNYTSPIHKVRVVFHENYITEDTTFLSAFFVAFVIIFIFVGTMYIVVTIKGRQNNYGQRCVPATSDEVSLDNISITNSFRRLARRRRSKLSYGNPGFESSVSKPINLSRLIKACENRAALDEEFEDIPTVCAKLEDLPPGAELKNRYSNVIPISATRVTLFSDRGNDASNYINANYVEGYDKAEKCYIACQAPLPSTIEDFWQMIWKEQSKVILMLTALVENGVEKCADYLPPSEVLDCHRLFGNFQVTLKKREVKDKYVVSSLQLKNVESGMWREITHFWYSSWPIRGVPTEQNSLINLLTEVRQSCRGISAPIVVHCSPGTGRTGTVIACDICLRQFDRTGSVDIVRTVTELRKCRAGAVKIKDQYFFIHKVLMCYAKKLNEGTTLESI